MTPLSPADGRWQNRRMPERAQPGPTAFVLAGGGTKGSFEVGVLQYLVGVERIAPEIITAASELSMAHRAHSHITIFHGGSHLTLISHPDAVTAVIASAICSLR